jgi:SAM dependent carboxyl methyltransferase
LRARIGDERPIPVFHIDEALNDFSALFQTLEADPASYLGGDRHVFPAAIGRSFYEQVLPRGQVTLGWSAQAVQWLSRLPGTVPGHFHSLLAEGATRQLFAAQSAADWRRFLSLRAAELRPGGRLVVLQPAIGDSGRQGMERLFQATDDSLGDLLAEGVIRADEKARMAIPDWVRSRGELLAPFAEGEGGTGLAVEACEVLDGPDPTWATFVADGDAASLGAQRARFIRATFGPTLGTALGPERTAEERLAFADALEAAVARRAAADPHEIPQTASVLVLARRPA